MPIFLVHWWKETIVLGFERMRATSALKNEKGKFTERDDFNFAKRGLTDLQSTLSGGMLLVIMGEITDELIF